MYTFPVAFGCEEIAWPTNGTTSNCLPYCETVIFAPTITTQIQKIVVVSYDIENHLVGSEENDLGFKG